MQKAGQIVLESLLGTPERQIAPRNIDLIEFRGLEAFVIDAEAPSGGGCGVYHDHRAPAGVRVDVDEAVEADVQAAFLSGLSHSGDGQPLTKVDEAAGEHPSAIARIDGPTHQDQAPRFGPNNRAHGDLRIQIEDEGAPGTHEALGFTGLEPPTLQRPATAGTEAISERLVMGVEI